jgi:hypothetical protein
MNDEINNNNNKICNFYHYFHHLHIMTHRPPWDWPI